MTRPTDRTHRCTDLELVLPIREQGYRRLQATSAVLGVDYNVLRRVVHGQACTEAEEAQVRQAWASYGPEAVQELMEEVLGGVVRGDNVHPAHARQLWTVTRRLLEWVQVG